MPEIKVLDSHIADLIAAGEVVERPASVAKELMENAIDAGAGKITVEISHGGMTFLRVTDDGRGIPAGELTTAFLRHATSKLRTQYDLEAIGTLGFRGEALAAIAAVSRVEVLTRTADAPLGASLSLEGGVAGPVEEAGCPQGTTMVVRDLFFNTPARLKFMKKDAAEGAAVFAVVQKVALSHPEVSVKFIRDGKQELLTPGDGQLQSAVYAVLGRELALGFRSVKSSGEDMTVSGFVSLPTCCRNSRNWQFFFVNGRQVKSRIMMAALEEAYKNQKMVGKFPGCVLHLETKLNAVDVNVHPAKTEVKFGSERQVFSAVYHAVLSALEGDRSRPALEMQTGQNETVKGWKPQDTVTPNQTKLTVPLQTSVRVQDGTYKMQNAEGRMQNGAEAKAPAPAAETAPRPKPSFTYVNTPVRPLRPAAPNTPAGASLRPAAEIAESPVGRPLGAAAQLTPDAPRTEAQRSGFGSERTSGAMSELSHLRGSEGYEVHTENRPPQGGPRTEAQRSGFDSERRRDVMSELCPSGRSEGYEVHADDVGAPVPNRPPAPETRADEDIGPYGTETPLPREDDWRLAGEVLNTYIIVEQGDTVFFIDKHAAHERMNFDRMKAQGYDPMAQTLLVPVTCRLAAEEQEALLARLPLLEEFGFDLDELGGKLVVRQAPFDVEVEDIPATLEEIAQKLLTGGHADPAAARDELLHTMACKAAIKGGWKTSEKELERVARAVMEGQVKYCPHGRPVAIQLTKKELEKQFKRA